MNRFKNYLTMIMLLLFYLVSDLFCAADAAEVLAGIDRYRIVSGSFRMSLRIRDFDDTRLKEEAFFKGFFYGDDRSLLICERGKNRGMKVLMKGDDMWINLSGSRRALRITPMQRLMGEASNGDVAKLSFSRDYNATILEADGDLLKPELQAKNSKATYQRILLYATKGSYRPVRAEFLLLSGKHFKTAYYQEGALADGREVIFKIRIEDKLNARRFTLMEFLGFSPDKIPEKYFNVVYLPQIETE